MLPRSAVTKRQQRKKIVLYRSWIEHPGSHEKRSFSFLHIRARVDRFVRTVRGCPRLVGFICPLLSLSLLQESERLSSSAVQWARRNSDLRRVFAQGLESGRSGPAQQKMSRAISWVVKTYHSNPSKDCELIISEKNEMCE